MTVNLLCPICRSAVDFSHMDEGSGNGTYICPCGAVFSFATLKWRVAEMPGSDMESAPRKRKNGRVNKR